MSGPTVDPVVYLDTEPGIHGAGVRIVGPCQGGRDSFGPRGGFSLTLFDTSDGEKVVAFMTRSHLAAIRDALNRALAS